MQNWIESEFFGYWKDAQSRIIKCLFVIDPGGVFYCLARNSPDPATGLMLRWSELVVRRSFDSQARWIERWIRQFEKKTTNLPGFSEQVQMITRAMHDWSDVQDELWKFWFELLDRSLGKNRESVSNRETLEAWKKLINEAENDLNQWSTKWEEQIHCKPLVVKELNRLIEKLGQEMLGWMQIQAILWQYGFDFVNSCALPKPEREAISRTKSEVSLDWDELSAISAMGPLTERLLHEQNIVSFRQFANLTDEEIADLEKNRIPLPGQILHMHGDPVEEPCFGPVSPRCFSSDLTL
ncbi:MAG: hypothetical protein L0Y39_04870 [Methylococcaceae bacterium]|nr:hypothetical protein [Methylococcaceae bacterium]